MGRTYERIEPHVAEWMLRQPMFFVATAPLAGDGHINCSPKGNRDELVLVGDRGIAYLDQTGSGVETIAHLAENSRIVVMFCAFDGPPRIVRLHGRGRSVRPGEPEFETLAPQFPGARRVGVRSIVIVEADRISDSCGYAVPLMSFDTHRTMLEEWADRKGEQGVVDYWAEKNAASLDGLPGLTA